MSCNLAFRSLTLCTRSLILSLSLLSISLVSPIARSRCSRTPSGWPNHELPDEGFVARKHMRCSPDSAAVKVKRPLFAPFWFTTRWSLAKVSCALRSWNETMRSIHCVGWDKNSYINGDLNFQTRLIRKFLGVSIELLRSVFTFSLRWAWCGQVAGCWLASFAFTIRSHYK